SLPRSSRLLQQIKSREEEDPDQIDEVPVQPDDLDPVRESLTVGVPHLRAGGQKIREHDHAAEHVQTVQTGHREVQAEEVARARIVAVAEAQRVLVSLD